ncbi:MAG: BLUF domain-containing protein [Actinomycetota bacterium]
MSTDTKPSDGAVETATIFQLGYASAATVEFSADDLLELLAKARINNSKLGVTGMLLYHEGSFIQVLEGEQSAVEKLYNHIAKDTRHAETMLLFRGMTTERAFDQWTMGFHQLSRDAGANPPGLNRFLDHGMAGITSEDGEKIRSVLLGFRDGKWRRTVDH